MKAGHRVKSVSMGKFTPEEVKALEEGGNQVGCETHSVNTRCGHARTTTQHCAGGAGAGQ